MSCLVYCMAETCYFIHCTTSPSCPNGYYFSGNYTFDGCHLVPRYVRFECCELDLQTSDGNLQSIYFILILICFIMF